MVPLTDLIHDNERPMQLKIAKIVSYKPKKHGYLQDISQTINISRSAYHIDIVPLMELVIPTYHKVAKIRKDKVSEISRSFVTDNATFDEFKQGFINVTSKGPIHSMQI